jgi:hypothetical protein
LELHCRQKALNVQSEKSQNLVVAAQQQAIYTQLINMIGRQHSGQLVGDLWIGCEPSGFIPHGGLSPVRYVWNELKKALILSNIVASTSES